MASACAHRLFTRGHVKYERLHGGSSSRPGRMSGWMAFSAAAAGRGSEFHSRAVSRASALSSPEAPSSGLLLLLKTRGRFSPVLQGTGELKNATLTSLTYIGVDAHDGVHIFRVIARLGTLNRARVIAASRPIARCSRSRETRSATDIERRAFRSNPRELKDPSHDRSTWRRNLLACVYSNSCFLTCTLLHNPGVSRIYISRTRSAFVDIPIYANLGLNRSGIRINLRASSTFRVPLKEGLLRPLSGRNTHSPSSYGDRYRP